MIKMAEEQNFGEIGENRPSLAQKKILKYRRICPF